MPDPAPRRLVLVRHAKSARPIGVPDHDRPLAGRGRRDAQAAGRWFRTEGPRPDLGLCSTAARARQTWEIVCRSLPPVPTRLSPELYGADADELLDLVAQVPASVGTLVVVGHEPTASITVLRLAAKRSERGALEALAEKYPTTGIAVLRFGGDWTSAADAHPVLETFTVPRG
ncbi:MAG TPA: histidine phosphatase family protein [Kineosporiaceae bacterium]|nr:histidine phosphatase family protein [Kineosporiaceae bacterium]